jgi:hypothetical protein
MTAVLIILGLAISAFVLFVVMGARSRTIFTNPGVLSDGQIGSTIELTRKIMARTTPGSPTWTRAAGKHKAAIDEQLRRKGAAPLDDIELVEPK